MAEKNFTLPDIDKTFDKQPTKTEEVGVLLPNNPNVGYHVSAKEMMIAGGGMLVAAIIFFIIKNSVSKMLVASHRKSPRSADMAGWSLFCILLLGSVAATMGALDSTKLLSLPYLIPLGLAMLTSLVMFLVALLSRH